MVFGRCQKIWYVHKELLYKHCDHGHGTGVLVQMKSGDYSAKFWHFIMHLY